MPGRGRLAGGIVAAGETGRGPSGVRDERARPAFRARGYCSRLSTVHTVWMPPRTV